ncbi:hypothetical protein ACWPKO_22570 (plasmid) [Coraliomargarita sp. W4R53]
MNETSEPSDDSDRDDLGDSSEAESAAVISPTQSGKSAAETILESFTSTLNLDVGRVTPRIDFSTVSATLTEPMARAIASTFEKIDFGAQPVVDAAIIKSLNNSISESVFPLGYFDELSKRKFPELSMHPDALEAVESMAVPARASDTPRVVSAPSEDVVVAELVENRELVEPDSVDAGSVDPVLAQNLEVNRRLVELFERSLEATGEANERTDVEREKNRKLGIVNVVLVFATLAATVVGVVFNVLL